MLLLQRTCVQFPELSVTAALRAAMTTPSSVVFSTFPSDFVSHTLSVIQVNSLLQRTGKMTVECSGQRENDSKARQQVALTREPLPSKEQAEIRKKKKQNGGVEPPDTKVKMLNPFLKMSNPLR